MKKLILVLSLLLACVWGLRAQSYRLEMPADIPQAAAQVLQQRLTQMLQGGGFTLDPEGTPLQVQAVVQDRMETPGSISQVALTVQLLLQADEASASFVLKGVGDSDADAWLRAVKQLLPRSKDAQNFLEKLK